MEVHAARPEAIHVGGDAMGFGGREVRESEWVKEL